MADNLTDLRPDPEHDLHQQEQWRSFELYEKIRIRERRHKLLTISLALLLFLGLCALPVVKERMPKWQTMRAAQRLSVEIEGLKRLAIQEKKPVRMTFSENDAYKVDVIEQCKPDAHVIRSETRKWDNENGELQVVPAYAAKALGVNLAVNEICFDPVYGLEDVKTKKVIIIAPVKDLTEKSETEGPDEGAESQRQKLDRASYIILESESAKTSFN